MNLNISPLLPAIASSTTTMISSLSGVSTLVIGILFAFAVVSFLVSLAEDRKWERERRDLFADADFIE